jgi:hypothetical protein
MIDMQSAPGVEEGRDGLRWSGFFAAARHLSIRLIEFQQ